MSALKRNRLSSLLIGLNMMLIMINSVSSFDSSLSSESVNFTSLTNQSSLDSVDPFVSDETKRHLNDPVIG